MVHSAAVLVAVVAAVAAVGVAWMGAQSGRLPMAATALHDDVHAHVVSLEHGEWAVVRAAHSGHVLYTGEWADHAPHGHGRASGVEAVCVHFEHGSAPARNVTARGWETLHAPHASACDGVQHVRNVTYVGAWRGGLRHGPWGEAVVRLADGHNVTFAGEWHEHAPRAGRLCLTRHRWCGDVSVHEDGEWWRFHGAWQLETGLQYTGEGRVVVFEEARGDEPPRAAHRAGVGVESDAKGGFFSGVFGTDGKRRGYGALQLPPTVDTDSSATSATTTTPPLQLQFYDHEGMLVNSTELARHASLPQHHALVVAIHEYEGDLALPHHIRDDALTLYRSLLAGGMDARNVHLLLNEYATVHSVSMALRMIASRVESDGVVLVYFVAHGGVSSTHADADVMFRLWDGFLPGATLSALLASIPTSTCAVLDVCYSGMYQLPASFVDKLRSASPHPRVVMASAKPQQRALVFPEGSAVFTQNLLRGLQCRSARGGASATEVVRVHDLFEFVSSRVVKQTNGLQSPVVSAQAADNFVLAWCPSMVPSGESQGLVWGQRALAQGVYDGQLLDNVPHGYGVLANGRTGERYAGLFAHGKRDGLGTSVDLVAEGSDEEYLIYHSGMWHDNQVRGLGKRSFSHINTTYEGVWGGVGYMHGIGRASLPGGREYEGQFAYHYQTGWGVLRMGEEGVDREELAGLWFENKLHGMGQRVWANGDVFAGTFEHGRRDGHGRMAMANNDTYVGGWAGDVQHGRGVFHLAAAGVDVHGVWASGQIAAIEGVCRDAPRVCWHGAIDRTTWRPHGAAVELRWDDSGQRVSCWSGTWVDGERAAGGVDCGVGE